MHPTIRLHSPHPVCHLQRLQNLLHVPRSRSRLAPQNNNNNNQQQPQQTEKKQKKRASETGGLPAFPEHSTLCTANTHRQEGRGRDRSRGKGRSRGRGRSRGSVTPRSRLQAPTPAQPLAKKKAAGEAARRRPWRCNCGSDRRNGTKHSAKHNVQTEGREAATPARSSRHAAAQADTACDAAASAGRL